MTIHCGSLRGVVPHYAYMGTRELIAALLGVSAYAPPKGYGPSLGDEQVTRIREELGGNLAQMPTTRLRWYLSDLETAQFLADSGDVSAAAQLYRAMRRDGTIAGLLGTLTGGIARLPKKFYGTHASVDALRANNGTRSVFDDMCPPSELALLAADGKALGVGVAELVPVAGREFPILIRQDPEFLRYRWYENRWYFQSIAGLLPITPGDGRWVLHTPGGRVSPWNSGIWPAIGQAFINKQHAQMYRANYCAKLANPARAAHSPLGADEPQAQSFFQRVMAWGVNTTFHLPPGWDVSLLELKGTGYEVFQADIDTADKEITISIAGQMVSVDGGAGFSNTDLHRSIRSDIIGEVAEGLDYTINTQVIPQWVATKYGPEAIPAAAVVKREIKRPKDLEAEARSMSITAQAVKELGEVLRGYGRELDIDELLVRYEIPVKGDGETGDANPDSSGRVSPTSDVPAEVIESARTRAARGRPALDIPWRRAA